MQITKFLTITALALFVQNVALADECRIIDNPYAPEFKDAKVREAIFESNGKIILEVLKSNSADSISKTDLDSLLNCMRSSEKLGDPVAGVTLANMLIHLAKPENLTEAYLTRVIANTHQRYDVMADLKRSFRNLGPDQQVLEMAFKGKTEADFVDIFSTESHLAVSDIEDLQMAYKDSWDNMPALANYLLTNSKKGSVGEMLGIIVLQEDSINTFKTHENNLDNHLIIADFVMNHLEYRPSYDFAKGAYEVALAQGSDAQKAHAKTQLQKLKTFSNSQQ